MKNNIVKPLTSILLWSFLSLILFSQECFAEVLRVGPGEKFIFPSVAAKYAQDGDVVEIDAKGIYVNDNAVWTQNNLVIRGVNGRPHIKSAELIPNGKAIWVVKGDNISVSNVELSGAKVSDKNGAALRLEGRGFQLSDCYIHDNENGILSGEIKDSDVVIDNCEFSFNGRGRGRTHNIYIGKVRSFTLKNSFSHHALVGHLVKSRAEKTYILYNRLFEGTASYSVDLPNGGYSLVMGNIIYQGDSTENWAIVAFGLEGYQYKLNALDVVYNTFLNDRSAGVFVKSESGGKVKVENNLFSGRGLISQGDVDDKNNIHENGIFNEFTEQRLSLKNVSIVKDKGKVFLDYYGKRMSPEFQVVDGKVVGRQILGGLSDIGANEFQ